MSAGPSSRASTMDVWASWSRLVAAALFAALALAVLVLTAPGAWQAEPTPEPRPRPVPFPSALAAQAQPPTPDLEPQATPLASAQPVTLPSPRQLLIDLGPPRSEVFVDGRRVGQTPFLGQVKCRPGLEIKIHVVPERGLPLEERRVCPP